MKIRRMLLGIFLVQLLALLPSAAYAQSSEGSPVSANEPLFGTWMNNEYKDTYHVWRFIYQADGKSFGWENGKPSEQPNNTEGRIAVDRKWLDSEGNTWYRIAVRWCFSPFSEAKTQKEYGLVNVLAAGDVLEGEWSSVDFPQGWGALGGKHYTYYRE